MDYMTADEMAEAKHKADMDDKMKAMIREVLFYVFLLFFLLVVINGQHDTNSYLQTPTPTFRHQLLPSELQLLPSDTNSYLQNSNVASLFNKYLNKDVSITLHGIRLIRRIRNY